MATTAGPAKARGAAPGPTEPRPSSSVVLLSATNQVLLQHRVRTSSAFPSAHVFPGGNVSDFHDGPPVPPAGDARRHSDSATYRMAAVRETFEETGILLARPRDRAGRTCEAEAELVHLPVAERDSARVKIHADEVKFCDWLHGIGGTADIDNLHAFSRWITPPAPAAAAGQKRFTTQMYLYMLPLFTRALSNASFQEGMVPTPDRTEVITTVFDDAEAWLQKQVSGEIIMFPPQVVLLHLIASLCSGNGYDADVVRDGEYYQAQRRALLKFLQKTPTGDSTHPTANIPWAEKVICPSVILSKGGGSVVLGLDKPGPELIDSQRGGEHDLVLALRFGKGGPTEGEVRRRADVVPQGHEQSKM